MTAWLSQFHFLRPEWFLALLPIALMWFLLRYWQQHQSGWQSVIAGHLTARLLENNRVRKQRPPLGLLLLGWIIAVVALAGPTWQQLPQPVYQVKQGHVIVMDMSLSMRATDLNPDRLTRARYKAIDLVALIDEGEMGLVAYAGDAFTISPLTTDGANLSTLIPSLSPEIMPVAGSDPVIGLKQAAELLRNAGYQQGNLYWITDGVTLAQVGEVRDYLSTLPYRVNILAVGTEEGAPIKQLDGQLLKRADGTIVIPRTEVDYLQQLAIAGRGQFSQISATEQDIKRLVEFDQLADTDSDQGENSVSGDSWEEAGPYLLLLLLPIAAYAFRRGLVLVVCLCVLYNPMQANAQSQPSPTISEPSDATPLPWWQRPFLNADQRGEHAFSQQQFDSAAAEFDDPMWRGSALYKAGDYQAALESYQQIDTPQSLYNQGNALAQLGELEKAIDAYTEALQRDPDLTDAATNKALLEQMLEQQQQSQQDSQQQNGDQSQDDSQQQEGDQNQQDQQEGQQEQSSDSASDSSESEQDQASQQDSQQQEQQSDQQSSDQQQQNGTEQEQQQQEQSESQQAQAEESEAKEQDEQQAMAASETQQPLTDAEREEQQRLNNLLKRVPDDPAFLLKRKMQLEAQKRRRQQVPQRDGSDW